MPRTPDANAAHAASSPAVRGSALAWLRGWWRGRVGAHAETGTDAVRARLPATVHVLGFREFTGPRRVQSGGMSALRARSVSGRAWLSAAHVYGSRP